MEAKVIKKTRKVKTEKVEYMTEEMMKNIYVFQEPYKTTKRAKPVLNPIKLGGYKK
jgi:hypothetical protein